jgi:hypothetical protein
VTRSRKSAKDAGQKFERLIADHLRDELGNEFIDIRPKNGRNDRGDIGGVRHFGQSVVVECKDYAGSIEAGPWVKEAETERGNDDALAGIVAIKRRGTTVPGEQFVLMTMDDFTALLNGSRPDA